MKFHLGTELGNCDDFLLKKNVAGWNPAQLFVCVFKKTFSRKMCTFFLYFLIVFYRHPTAPFQCLILTRLFVPLIISHYNKETDLCIMTLNYKL